MPTDAAQVAYIASQLIGHVFVMDTMVHHPAYEHLAKEYEQRVARMKHTMTEWVHDLQDWSENGADEAEGDEQ
jgi:hypothetical protein